MEAGSVGTEGGRRMVARAERPVSQRSIAVLFLTAVVTLYALAGLVVYALVTGPVDQLLGWIGL